MDTPLRLTMCSARAGALTSVSNLHGTLPSERYPTTSTMFHPGLGVDVMKPYVGLPCSRAFGGGGGGGGDAGGGEGGGTRGGGGGTRGRKVHRRKQEILARLYVILQYRV